MKTDLDGKRILVTGASGGIGHACARAFADEGAQLALHGHTNVAALQQLQAELAVRTQAVQADLTDERQVQQLFEAVDAEFGGLDVLVANAGRFVLEPIPITDMALSQWHDTVEADQTSVFLCARAFFRMLQRTRPEAASVVLVGSTSAMFGEEGHADYAAAKAAVHYGLTRTLKNEIVRIVPRGRVNAVAPGLTWTPMADRERRDRDAWARALQTRALPQLAQPEDVARAVVFLASETTASHITGAILPVSGGLEGRIVRAHDDRDTERP